MTEPDETQLPPSTRITTDELRRMEAAAHARDDELAEKLADDPVKLAADIRSRAACTTRLYYTERRVHARACDVMSEVLGEDIHDVVVGAKRLAAIVAELRQRPAANKPPSTGLPLLDWAGSTKAGAP